MRVPFWILVLTVAAATRVDARPTAPRAVHPVSPGARDSVPLIADGCPTFSWSIDPAAERYELEIWQVSETAIHGESAELAVPSRVYGVAVAGAASSWSPATDRCLESANQYLWIVRGIYAERQGEWSEPAGFSVSAVPSQRELESALDVLRRHLEGADSGLVASGRVPRSASHPPSARGSAAKASASGAVVEAVRGEASDLSGPAFGVSGLTQSPGGAGVRAENVAGGADLVVVGGVPLAITEAGFDRSDASNQVIAFTNAGAGSLDLSVEGGVVAAQFAGAGSGLTGVDAATVGGFDASAFAPTTHSHFAQLFGGSNDNFGLRVNNAGANSAIVGFVSSTGIVGQGALRGESAAQGGIGVQGIVSDGSSTTTGVSGSSGSTSGTGVDGSASTPTGTTFGVRGRTASSGGIGGFFVNTNGGLLLAASNANNISNLKFKVANNGDVFADGTYHCGANIDDSAGDLNEAELDPCVRDSSPADFAELFESLDLDLRAGEVVALNPDGQLQRTRRALDPRAVGVISTRPSYLGNARHAGKPGWSALALSGVVPVAVTAEAGAIMPGDWLVSSSAPGRAMRCRTLSACAGRTIGKALDSLPAGVGQVRMLVIAR